MSLQTLFKSVSDVERFEDVARQHGYTNFNKRGGFYCLSALNDFAAGWVAARKEAVRLAQQEEFPLRLPSPNLTLEEAAAYKARWDFIQDHCASYAPADEEPKPRKIAIIGGTDSLAVRVQKHLQNNIRQGGEAQ